MQYLSVVSGWLGFAGSLGYVYMLSQEAQWPFFYIVPTELICVPVSVYTEVEVGWSNRPKTEVTHCV